MIAQTVTQQVILIPGIVGIIIFAVITLGYLLWRKLSDRNRSDELATQEWLGE